MRLESQSGAYATFLSLSEDLSESGMAIVPMLSAHKIWPPAVVKSRHFGQSSSMNRSLLFVRWREAHESKYHTSRGACIFDFFTMLATPGWKGLGSELSSLSVAAAMCARFRVGYCFVDSSGLGFFRWLRDCCSEDRWSGSLQSRPKCPYFWQL